MGNNTKGFAELIEDAQRKPKGAIAPLEVTSPFALPVPPDHRVVEDDKDPTKVPGVVEYDYEAHVDVFCLNQGEERQEYVDILNQILSGKAMLRYEDRSMTKDGDSMVTICWMTRVAKAKPTTSPRGDA